MRGVVALEPGREAPGGGARVRGPRAGAPSRLGSPRMAENPRELIRAAQSAETQGDVARAVECLQKAAELYRQAGNPSRALQLLRHAQRLDGSRADIADAVNRLEWMPEPVLTWPGSDADDEEALPASGLVRSLESELLPDVVHRQRLIEDALREAALHAGDDAPRDAAQAWVIESEVAEDLQRLEVQIARVAGAVEGAEDSSSPLDATVDVRGGVASRLSWGREAPGRNVPSTSALAPAAVSAERSGRNVPSTSTPPGGESAELPGGRVSSASIPAPELASADRPQDGMGEREHPGDEVSTTRLASSRMVGAAEDAPFGEDILTDARPRRRREARLIERGPTRADAALDAWCSFCCRPRTDTGDLVAGPAGAFICKSCLTESQSLIGDVTPVPLPTVSRPERPVTPVLGLVGQGATQALLTQSLGAHARTLLLVGPEGSGKSVWFQQLQREAVGVITTVADLDLTTSSRTLLVEDVDRLDASSHATLRAFLARDSRPAVVLSARGVGTEARGLSLRGDSHSVPVPTTAALTQSVRGTVPTDILEQVQVLLTLQVPTQSEFVEIARQRLASREPAVSASEDVLIALAQEASRSPRAGHELHALLNRVPTGTWSLAPTVKPSPPRKARKKRTS
ncbi:ClpX C4-type zinc finger protein [Myxococcus xanthus]|uniref:ClpX C4-type zinc finger protein n=1 Tax=Myxococcus xanthus TaxID=34 RepID=UPI003AB495D2